MFLLCSVRWTWNLLLLKVFTQFLHTVAAVLTVAAENPWPLIQSAKRCIFQTNRLFPVPDQHFDGKYSIKYIVADFHRFHAFSHTKPEKQAQKMLLKRTTLKLEFCVVFRNKIMLGKKTTALLVQMPAFVWLWNTRIALEKAVKLLFKWDTCALRHRQISPQSQQCKCNYALVTLSRQFTEFSFLWTVATKGRPCSYCCKRNFEFATKCELNPQFVECLKNLLIQWINLNRSFLQ